MISPAAEALCAEAKLWKGLSKVPHAPPHPLLTNQNLKGFPVHGSIAALRFLPLSTTMISSRTGNCTKRSRMRHALEQEEKQPLVLFFKRWRWPKGNDTNTI